MATKTSTKSTTKVSNWAPNPKQKAFLSALADGPKTLSEASAVAGIEIKSGTINTLVSKGMVETRDCEFECNVVRKDNGTIVGTMKKKVKVYALPGGFDAEDSAEADGEAVETTDAVED